MHKEKAFKASQKAKTLRILSSIDLKERRMQINADFMFNAVFDENNRFCSHIKVGSSNIFRLMSCTYDVKRAHQYFYYGDCGSTGTIWEAYIAKQNYFYTIDGTRVDYKVIARQPFAQSKACKFVTATSDLLVKYKVTKNRWKIALLEIKSTSNNKKFEQFKNSSNTEQNTQLQVALQCFNIKTGFLIFIYGDVN